MRATSTLLVVFALFGAWNSQASTSYMSGTPTLIQLALQDVYGANAGVGPKNGQCILCHNSEVGGSGNLNPYFGMDFQMAAIAEGYGTGGNNRTRNQLAVIFDNLAFAQKDSDNDGILNGEEFENNTDPSENVSGASPTGGSGGGGCGRIASPQSIPTASHWLLVLFPLLLLTRLKRLLTTR